MGKVPEGRALTSPDAPRAASLAKAIWAVAGALAAAAAAIFWAGYNWSEVNRKLNKIDELEQKLSYMQNLSPPPQSGPATPFGRAGAPAAKCGKGEVVTGVQIGESLAVWCSPLVK
jgi:hypothetical protein